MNKTTRPLSAVCLALFAGHGIVCGESIANTIRRFDVNKDGQLDAQEFARAQSAVGRPTKTAAGAARADSVRQEANHLLRTGGYQNSSKMGILIQAAERLNVPLSTMADEPIERNAKTVSERQIAARLVQDVTPKSEALTWDDELTKWLKDNFSIRSSSEFFENAQFGHPAKISWTKSKGQKSFYTIDAAVLWRPDVLRKNWITINEDDPANPSVEHTQHTQFMGGHLHWQIAPSFEAHVSTEVGASKDQLRYAAETALRWDTPSGIKDELNAAAGKFEQMPLRVSAVNINLSPEYVTDRGNHIQTTGGILTIAPVVPRLGINTLFPIALFGSKDWSWLLQARAGFKAIEVEEGEKLLATGLRQAAVDRSNGAFTADVGAALNWKDRVELSGTINHYMEAYGNLGTHTFYEVSAAFQLDPASHYTAGITYSRGEAQPKFTEIDTVTAWFGLEF